MNANDYQQQAGRTLLDTPDQMPTGLEYMIMWNAMGLAGEAGELASMFSQGTPVDPLELRKEAGDLLWYVAANCSKLGLLLESVWLANHYQGRASFTHMQMPPERTVLRLLGSVGIAVDSLKKQICHRHGLNVLALTEQLGDVLYDVEILCAQHDLPMADVMSANILKLKQRYPDGYSSDASKDWQATR